MKHGNRFKDLMGQQFGRLTVLAFMEISPSKKTLWICECSCGQRVIAESHNLISGHTKSCGCYRKEKSTKLLETHGKRTHPLYNVWAGLWQRCHNPKNPAYKRYGGRGIYVCFEWRNFEGFYEWAIVNGYKKGLTIDRLDNNGSYTPGNCRFVSRHIQNSNKSVSKRWFIKGKKFRTAKEAAEFYGVVPSTIYSWCYGYAPRNTEARSDCFSSLAYP